MGTIMNSKEMGDFLKLSTSTICKLATKGELPGFKIGDSWRFDMDDLLRLLKAQKEKIKQNNPK